MWQDVSGYVGMCRDVMGCGGLGIAGIAAPECADHAEDPDEMVESGTEEPLVPRGVLRMEGIVEIEKKLGQD